MADVPAARDGAPCARPDAGPPAHHDERHRHSGSAPGAPAAPGAQDDDPGADASESPIPGARCPRRRARVRRSFTTLIRIPQGPRPPFALIVFGHGFAVSPTPYAPLLDAWARAGYIVASPVFPLENAGAPGGPDENDLPNQPQDMSLVIDRMLSGSIGRLVRHHRIAVAGQSDGGDTALAAAFDPRVRDARIGAAVILSGAEDPFISRFSIPARHVPLLATQGTADTINPPWMTHQFYDPATRAQVPAQAERRRASAALHRAGRHAQHGGARDDRVSQLLSARQLRALGSLPGQGHHGDALRADRTLIRPGSAAARGIVTVWVLQVSFVPHPM